MKTRKRRMEYFSFYDHTSLEEHFAKMAKKGWLIESISNLYYTYRRIEPKDIHFCVSYYPRASDFDPEPSVDQQTFHDFCAHTGWQLACTWHQMQVFYNELKSPIPLDTDPVMEVDTLHRACKKNFLPSYYCLLALGLFMGGYVLTRIYFDPIGLLSSSSQLLTGVANLCMLLISLVELITYFTWYRKAKLAAEDGIFVDTPSTTGFQKSIVGILLIALVWWLVNLFSLRNRVLGWIAVAMLVAMFAVILTVNGIKQGLKKAKASRGLNKALTLAACFLLPSVLIYAIIYVGMVIQAHDLRQHVPFDDAVIPLTVSDFLEVDEDDYIKTNRNNETFLVGQRVVDIFGDWQAEGGIELPDLRYKVTTVHVPFLYDWCAKQVFRDQDEINNGVPEGHRDIYKETDAAPWSANAAYRLYQEEGWWQNNFLLCYDDRIIEIRFDWEPTPDDMSIVSQKLNP